ncbi:MAG: hypothetical protein WBA12_03845 [Catalinimonas sp.]
MQVQVVPEVRPAPWQPLGELSEGRTFVWEGQRYRRGPLRRTRVLCRDLRSGRAFAFSADAWVELDA